VGDRIRLPFGTLVVAMRETFSHCMFPGAIVHLVVDNGLDSIPVPRVAMIASRQKCAPPKTLASTRLSTSIDKHSKADGGLKTFTFDKIGTGGGELDDHYVFVTYAFHVVLCCVVPVYD
jgi:hypothetical protein